MKPRYQVFSSKSPLFKFTKSETSFLLSVLITSESSQPPRWGSPCVTGQRLRSGNHRDSRVCQSNDGWRRTGCHSDSQNLEEKEANGSIKLGRFIIDITCIWTPETKTHISLFWGRMAIFFNLGLFHFSGADPKSVC